MATLLRRTRILLRSQINPTRLFPEARAFVILSVLLREKYQILYTYIQIYYSPISSLRNSSKSRHYMIVEEDTLSLTFLGLVGSRGSFFIPPFTRLILRFTHFHIFSRKLTALTVLWWFAFGVYECKRLLICNTSARASEFAF